MSKKKKTPAKAITSNELVATMIVSFLNYERVATSKLSIKAYGAKAKLASSYLYDLKIRSWVMYSIVEKSFILLDHD